MFQQNKKSKPTRGKTVDSEVEVATYERSKGSNQEKGMVNSEQWLLDWPQSSFRFFKLLQKYSDELLGQPNIRGRTKPYSTDIEAQIPSRRRSQAG